MLGVQPLIGRLFTPEEDRAGAPGTLLLSYSLWQSNFGGDAGVLGRKVRLDDETYTVIGVMPRGFHFPFSTGELWTPMQFQEEDFQDRNIITCMWLPDSNRESHSSRLNLNWRW